MNIIQNNEERRQLLPEYLDKYQAAEYGRTTTKTLALFRKYGLIKYVKVGQEFIYKKSWIDEFMETWAGYDMSNPEKIRASMKERQIQEARR